MDTTSVAELLRHSAASHEFKAAVRSLAAGDLDHAARRIQFGPGESPTKVLYTILQVLEQHPDLSIESARVEGLPDAADYSGVIVIAPDNVRFRFVWDPRWKAEQLGWTTPKGVPDAGRAARELGHQCFRHFARAL